MQRQEDHVTSPSIASHAVALAAGAESGEHATTAASATAASVPVNHAVYPSHCLVLRLRHACADLALPASHRRPSFDAPAPAAALFPAVRMELRRLLPRELPRPRGERAPQIQLPTPTLPARPLSPSL